MSTTRDVAGGPLIGNLGRFLDDVHARPRRKDTP